VGRARPILVAQAIPALSRHFPVPHAGRTWNRSSRSWQVWKAWTYQDNDRVREVRTAHHSSEGRPCAPRTVTVDRGRWDLLVAHRKPTTRKNIPINVVALRRQGPDTDRKEAVIKRRTSDPRPGA
jgi:hypothetical protein